MVTSVASVAMMIIDWRLKARIPGEGGPSSAMSITEGDSFTLFAIVHRMRHVVDSGRLNIADR